MCFILLWIFSSPVLISGDYTAIIALDATPAAESDIPRVYGTDLAELIYSSVETEDYRSFVREISENGSRFITDSSEINLENNRQAREYLKKKLVNVSKGRIEVEEIGIYRNVVGKLPGYLPGNNPAFAVSAHSILLRRRLVQIAMVVESQQFSPLRKSCLSLSGLLTYTSLPSMVCSDIGSCREVLRWQMSLMIEG